MTASSASAPQLHDPAVQKTLRALTLAAVGVVFGDIGTSPLYTLKECFSQTHGHRLALVEPNIYGILSLIFWSMLIVVVLKYLILIMRADNKGEGGILALMALAMHTSGRKRGQFSVFVVLGLAGAALFYGDGVITPAISVLSAMEGLSVATPQLSHAVLPITMLVLVLLFLLQSRGTGTVGKLFGPVMVLWFATLAVLGLYNILRVPGILWALSPHHALIYLKAQPWEAFLSLGAVVLALTGGEAVYADMGHFGRKPIRIGWFTLVYPALVLNYFGQGALLLEHPEAAENPFYFAAPAAAQLPLVILATVAAVIASQAVISGVYSVTWQALQLGYCPRMNVRHTSEQEYGQIYVPFINWALLAAVLMLVLGFRSSDNLAAAYGIAVTGTMVVTTVLAFVVLKKRIRLPLWLLYPLLGFFLLVDLAFFTANALKFFDGGWVPIVLGLFLLYAMFTWKVGRRVLYHRLHDGEMPLEQFVSAIEAHPPQRVEGTAVFMTGNCQVVPSALLHNIKHNKILHQHVILLTITISHEPYVPYAQRFQIQRIGEHFWQVEAHYGFKQDSSVPDLMSLLAPQLPFHFSLMETSFFLSRETIVLGKSRSLNWLSRRLFSVMQHNATRPTQFFKLPPNRVVEMGTQVVL